MMLRVNNQHGDTIVEVMIVLAILGFALSISYATANRSLLNTRQAQESSQATEYAESQVEDLYDLAPASTPGDTTNPNNIFQTTTYCIQSSSSGLAIKTDPSQCAFSSIPYEVLIYNCDDTMLMGTNPCDSGVVPDSDTLIVQVTWPDVMGDGTDSSTLVYRDHHTTTPAVAAAAVATPPMVSWYNDGANGDGDFFGSCTPPGCSATSSTEATIQSGNSITFYYDKQVPPPAPEVGAAAGDSNLNFKLCYDPTSPSANVSVSIGGTPGPSFSLDSGATSDGLYNCSSLWKYVYLPGSINIPNNSDDSLVINVSGGTLVLENVTIVGTTG